MSSLLLTGISYLLKIFMTGFFVENSQFSRVSYDFLEINAFEINPILTIIAFSAVSGIISTLFYVLDKSD
jgi:hypothetical protein